MPQNESPRLLPPPARSRSAARRSALGPPVCEGAGSRDGPGAAPAAESAGPAGLEARVEARGPLPAGASALGGAGSCLLPRSPDGAATRGRRRRRRVPRWKALLRPGSSLPAHLGEEPPSALAPSSPPPAPPEGSLGPAACRAGDCCSLVAWHFSADGVRDAAAASSGAWGGG